MTGSSGYRAASVDLLLGGDCVGCSRPGPSLCPMCLTHLDGLPVRHRPSPCPVGLPPVYCVAAYDGVAQRALIAHKERGRLSLAKPLGRALAVGVLGALGAATGAPSAVHLVPAPTRRAVVRRRGQDPLLRLTGKCARVLRGAGVACTVSPVLRLTRRVEDQAGLDAPARRANLAEAFGVGRGRPLQGWEVIVVDDIVTTGSTAAEMARALRAAGADVLGAAAVAATQRHARSRPGDWCRVGAATDYCL